MEYRCRHDLMWQILDYCFSRPRSLSEIYATLHLKYPTIYEQLFGLVTLELVDAVNPDGSQPFEGKHIFEMVGSDTKELRKVFHRFNLKDYDYQTTALGELMLENQKRFFGIMEPIVGIQLITTFSPKVSPKVNWKRPKRTRDLPHNKHQNVLIKRLL